ncbi:MAG: DMT family transporter [Desulfatiglandaceae bacterium]
MRTGPMLVYLELIFTAIFWGGTFVAGRIVAPEVGPFSAAFLRFLTASVCLLALNWRSYGGGMSLPDRRLLISLILLGLTGVFSYNVFFFMGLERIEAGRASLIIANNPVFIALFNALIFRERLYPLAVAGILLSLTGAGIVITRGNMVHALEGGVGPGELFMFGCVLSWSAYSLIGRRVLIRLTPLVSVTWASVLGMAALAPPACMEGLFSEIGTLSAPAWMGILYLGIFGTVAGFVLYYRGIREIGPARASQFINLVPVSAILMAALILDEPLTPSLMVGGLLVLTGITLTNVASTRAVKR